MYRLSLFNYNMVMLDFLINPMAGKKDLLPNFGLQ